MTLSQGRSTPLATMVHDMSTNVSSNLRPRRRKLLGLTAIGVGGFWGLPVLAQPAPTPSANTSVPAPAPSANTSAPAAAPSANTSAPAATSADTATPPPYPTAEPLPPLDESAAPEAPASAETTGDLPTSPVPGQAETEPNEPTIFEPPLPQAYVNREQSGTLVPPPPPRHVAPRSSFWAGVRPGVMVPMGSAWLDGEPLNDLCCIESARPLAEFASAGPSLGVEAGVRFGRHYQGFAFWEHAWLGSGTLENAFGGQDGADTTVFGGGFRFNTHPDGIGMVVEISLGYRTFEAQWNNGTRLTASDDLFSTQLGFGAAWRVNPYTSLELLLRIGGGALTDIKWRFADGTTENAVSRYDRYGQYIPFGLQLASHWDIVRSDD